MWMSQAARNTVEKVIASCAKLWCVRFYLLELAVELYEQDFDW